MSLDEFDASRMARALELAALGEGYVEPNPMVGCVIVRDGEVVGEGHHRRYGGPHAEVEALQTAGARAQRATAYVTLEPCAHQGKTPPCVEALVRAQVARVVIAQPDPFPQVAGHGIAALERAGIAVEVGLLAAEAARLNAPYLKLLSSGRPWVIAKWAMTLDGKLATTTGDSRWISSAAARTIVHRIRGRVDAVLVGRGTATTDDPLLTARPAGPRLATRIVLDKHALLSPASKLAVSARQAPVLIACGTHPIARNVDELVASGCEIVECPGKNRAERLAWLLDELGRRRMTNVLVEGGSQVLGSFFDAGQIDEVHVFIAPKLIGGATASGPIGGDGVKRMAQALNLAAPCIEVIRDDVYLHGRATRG
jgi:diaminohydroxyphosphoribosylaminopyrimidine deaminase/5-amino-6-(5-phosphoribosylamino)uracil reductase